MAEAGERQRQKAAAARAALAWITEGGVIGVGTGSTTDCFIDLLAELPRPIAAAVASSEATAARLRARGVRVVTLDEVDRLPLYVDGVDEATRERLLIKGGGGALTREKIVAAASERFVCIGDASKLVERLGAFPLPVEVLPVALGFVTRELRRWGGTPELRRDFVTDNGNRILDVAGLDLTEPARVEAELDHVPGIVASGLFCRRPADVLLVADDRGVERY